MMQANWSLILNILLLIGVIGAIGRLMSVRKQSLNAQRYEPSLGKAESPPQEAPSFHDDIISVRKVTRDHLFESDELIEEGLSEYDDMLACQSAPKVPMPEDEPKLETKPKASTQPASTVVMFLMAKEHRQFAGYELLQTVLASGLRFGEGQLFHRHQYTNGQGPVLCSLAAATESGVFDLQNIGGFSVRGLCLFMHASNNPLVDEERFSIMLETAKQLSEGLDAYLLDDQRKPLTKQGVMRYRRLLHIEEIAQEHAMA